MKYFYAPGSYAAHEASMAPPEQREAAAPAYRIIVAARRLKDTETQRLPDLGKLLITLRGEGASTTDATYAMAEEIATATLIESVALRFVLPDGRRGAALWWDWRWHCAIVREIGVLTREHLEAVITGAPWPPPPIACLRCGTAVRKNVDGSPRAHKRPVWHPPLTERCL